MKKATPAKKAEKVKTPAKKASAKPSVKKQQVSEAKPVQTPAQPVQEASQPA